MVVKKSKIISIALLLALALSPVCAASLSGGNNLVQLDLKRASNDSVNVTLFTSNNYNDNVMVRKKSDNKYVILIPKVQSYGYSSPSLNGVKDLVSNIDVKTVNDTSGGYTKVTLITKKPLDIKTNTMQSTPVTEEEKVYKTLIAEANTAKNNIAAPIHKKTPAKTEITVNKATLTANKTADSQTKPAKTSPQSKQSVRQDQPKAAQKLNIKHVPDIKPNLELQEIANENLQKQTRKEHLAELINEVKQEQAEKQAPAIPPTTVVADTNPPSDVKNITEMPKISKSSTAYTFKHKIKSLYNRIPKKAGIITMTLLGLLFLLKLIKPSSRQNTPLQKPYAPIPNTNSAASQKTNNYSTITNNKELSWQEKYQRYLDASAKPVPRGNNKGNYTFIKTPAEPDNITQKRDELEKLLDEMPAYQNPNIEPEIVENVQSEDNSITNTIKFKAFDTHRQSLEITDRNKIKSRFKKYEVERPMHEQKNIELGTSPLHTNPRSLKNANLNIEDVDKNRIKYKPTNYIMSSVEEYFSLLDKEPVQEYKTAKQQEFSAPVMRKTGNDFKKLTNPISKLKNETKSSYLNSLIIKSGFNIDDKKGFYMVNLDGKSALIGKVNDEITVLKQYDKVVDTPVQVRHDNANVYMVKAENFKSLVEVNNDKMGVLIEL